MTSSYKLQDLADEAGIAPRTIRYYVQRGLLPAPEFRGKDTAYSREHLLRLNVIKRLQQAHLPLDEIQNRLARATEADLERLAQTEVSGLGDTPFAELRDSSPVENPGQTYRTSGRQGSFSTISASAARVYVLAPGVELLVRDDVPTASLALVRDILNRFSTTQDDKDADR